MSHGASRVPASKPDILVVDDRANMLQLLQKVLGADATVFTAQSGADAIALLESRPVAAVVCDLRLPDLSGIEVLTSMPALTASGRIRVDDGLRLCPDGR